MKWRWRPRGGWWRFLARVLVGSVLGLVLLLVVLVTLARQPRSMSFIFSTMIGLGLNQAPEVPRVETPVEPAGLLAQPDRPGQGIRPEALFVRTNVWDVRLHFTSNEWHALGPKRIPAVRDVFSRDGRINLRNPLASRPGVAGSMGIDLPWSVGKATVAGIEMDRVAIRFKGNGTFLDSSRTCRRSFKLDLNEHVPDRALAGRKMLNLGNLGTDVTAGLEAVGYRLHEAAGVPAPHTAFARVTLSVDEWFTNRLLGVYLLVEDVDAAWVTSRFGKRGAVVFKPVTYDLFEDLGPDWAAYEPVYQPKTKLNDEDRRRLMATAQFFSESPDAEFERGLGEYLDLDQVARFLACQVLLSNYDGILGTGQNFLMYLDVRSGRFGFGAWDLDQAWGRIGFAGTAKHRVQASIRHPWMGRNSFLERLFRVESFRSRYEAALRQILERWFTPEFLDPQFAEISRAVRPFLAEESAEKAARHDRALAAPRGTEDGDSPAEGAGEDGRLRRFVRDRAASVQAQLEGREDGEIVRMQMFW